MDDDAAPTSVTVAVVDRVRAPSYSTTISRSYTREVRRRDHARRCIDAHRAGYDAPRRLGTLVKRS